MAQAQITNFFNKRKRAGDDCKAKSKVLVLDDVISRKLTEEETEASLQDGLALNGSTVGTKISAKKVYHSISQEMGPKEKVNYTGGTSDRKRTAKQTLIKKPKTDIRLAFKAKDMNSVGSTSITTSGNVCSGSCDPGPSVIPLKVPEKSENNVVFELLGGLSPKKNKKDLQINKVGTNLLGDKEIKNAREELGLLTPRKKTEQKQKELTLSDLKAKICRSARLTDLRESIKQFNKAENQLKDLEVEREKLETTSPQLQKFKSINLEVPVSPQKTSLTSPLKGSPFKSPVGSPLKAPAYQRYAHLIESGVPALTLPYSFRCLAEVFRSADTVTSIFYNRKEVVTFSKLKSAVQEMLRRNFMESHLGKIKRVQPKAYKFHQEKLRTFGSTLKYELVVTPVISDSESASGNHPLMTPSILLERRQKFHECLLQIVKDHHENFLRSLDPPLLISRERLTRWHPDFDLDCVPNIEADELPRPPGDEKCSTAKNVLDHARKLFSGNNKIEKALQAVSESKNSTEHKVEPTDVNNTINTQVQGESPLLKGIPKALLEKVRARQAAKALAAMTRTPAQDREALQYSRLPEMARIIRNVFVAEKKTVLLLETAVMKLSNSYREKLPTVDLESHIRLIMTVVPDWLKIHEVRKAEYLKMTKNLDMSNIIKKLEETAQEKLQIDNTN